MNHQHHPWFNFIVGGLVALALLFFFFLCSPR
jgi:hypothetical protein